MPNDDQIPGKGVDGETVPPKVPAEATPKAPSSDPLDAITDPDALRLEAKKFRAIRIRAEKEEEEEEEGEEEEAPSSVYATKDDLKKLATNEAKKLVPEHVRDAWDELVAIPLGGFDAMDAESIAQNMQKRFNIYLIDNPDKAPDPTNDFTVTPHMPIGGGGTHKTKTVERPLPGFKEPAQPDDWYPKEP